MPLKETGTEEVKANLQKLINLTSKRTGQNALKRGLINANKPLLDAAKTFAPNDTILQSLKSDDKLDPSILAAKEENKPGQIRVFTGSSAALAHLFEFGTAPRFNTGKKREKAGKTPTYKGRSTGQMIADPFMRPAFDQAADDVEKNIHKELNDAILNAIGRAERKAAKIAEGGNE